MTLERIAETSLARVALIGLAIAAGLQLLRLGGLVHMAETWPLPMFALVLAWRLIPLPLILVMAALLVRGVSRGLG